MSTLARSFTALASEARTLAERTSYCCAPASAPGEKASAAAAKSAAASVAGRRLTMREARLHMPRGLGERHLGGGRVAPVLVLHHAFLQAALADHDAMRDSDEFLVGEQHAGALVAIVEESLDAGARELGIEPLCGGLHGLALAVAERDDGDRERRHRIGAGDPLVVVVLLDGGGDDARDADAVAAHLHRPGLALLVDVGDAHLLGIGGAQLEHVPHLDAARDL